MTFVNRNGKIRKRAKRVTDTNTLPRKLVAQLAELINTEIAGARFRFGSNAFSGPRLAMILKETDVPDILAANAVAVEIVEKVEQMRSYGECVGNDLADAIGRFRQLQGKD